MVATPEAPSIPQLASNGHAMDSSPDALGLMRESNDVLDDVDALHGRLNKDGYVLLRGLLDRDAVIDARRVMTERLLREGYLDPNEDPMLAIAKPDTKMTWYPELAHNNPPLRHVLYGGEMMAFWDRFLGGKSFCFDYTWFRAVAPGFGTASHLDSVYMGRGTHNLYTAWTPIGSVAFDDSVLLCLEASHNNQRLRSTYGMMDVDTFCTNKPPESKSAKGPWAKTGGGLTRNVNQIRRAVGGRWVTTQFEPGDVLFFSIFTIHASTDNKGRSIRLSSDTRYQLDSDPKDERWIGENPIAHGAAGKRGLIC